MRAQLKVDVRLSGGLRRFASGNDGTLSAFDRAFGIS
jgi:hypothetical protein